MGNRSIAANLGIYVYGGAAIALGLIGLAWGDFATNWQRVEADVPFRHVLAYIAAICEVSAGVVVLWRGSERLGAWILTALYSVFTLLWVPKIVAAPQIYDSWGNFFEEFSLVVGGLVLCAVLAPGGSLLSRKEALIARVYGVCAISFGMVHIVYFSGLPAWVPKWIPPGQTFWAAATTVCFLLAAAAILSGIRAALAARLLTAMIVGFELLVWAPKVVAAPRDHFAWSGNGINLVMAGAAWVVSDSISRSARRKPEFENLVRRSAVLPEKGRERPVERTV